MMKIPEEKIEEIRSASDIVDIISSYVQLKRRGKSYIGLCPFHTEKTPSFTVSPDKQMYYCFGCSEGGNVISFVMKAEKLSFPEAVRSLAEKAGISLPSGGPDDSQSSENEQIFRANAIAARFFHNSMMDTAEGEYALNYFRERGFSDVTIKKFGLGYAPRARQVLTEHAREQGLDSEYLENAGLIGKREDGSYYERFRGRAIFPIFSISGRVVAFAARQLYDDDTLAKYINSPETPVYQKGSILYGLSMTRDHIRKAEYALLVEGYTDLISLYQEGIQNVVATSGTALTEEQIRIIGRYAGTVVIVYDADSAGSAAALRGVDLILEKGLDVRIVQLPENEDPDSFMRTGGKDAFIDLIDQGVSFIDFKARILKKGGFFDSPEKQAGAIRSIIGTLALIPDELKRNLFIKSIAERYGLYESTLHRELDSLLRKKRNPVPVRSPVKPGGRSAVSLPDLSETEMRQGTKAAFTAAERDILKLILVSEREVIEHIYSQITSDELNHPEARAIFTGLRDLYRRTGSINIKSAVNSESLAIYSSVITRIIADKYEVSGRWEIIRGFEDFSVNMQLAGDAIRKLKENNIRRQMESVRKQIKELERTGEDSISLTREYQILEKELAMVENKYTQRIK